MQASLKYWPLFPLLSLAGAAFGRNAGEAVTPAFADVRATIEAAAATHGDTNVLVVFDLDNTLLATDTDLGSEHWFLWQAGLIGDGTAPRQADAAAASVPALLQAQGWILQVASMHADEARIATDLGELQERGVHIMNLTSRNLDLRDATIRELSRNGIDLSKTAPGPAGGYAAPFLLELPSTEPAAKSVVFDRGVLLTQGQNKGLILRALLAKTGHETAAIVFVDDRQRHLDNVQAAFKDRAEDVYTVRYTHEVTHVDAFQASDKETVKAQWCAFSNGLAASVFAATPAADRPFLACTQASK